MPFQPKFTSGPSFVSGGGQCGAQHVLQVRTSEDHWETIEFSAGDDMQRLGHDFILRHGLKEAFRPGLVAKMQQMVSIRQDYGLVDIVDLI